MIDTLKFLTYLAVMAGVTYLVRMLPLVLCRKRISSRFVRSFLYYIPYTVLSIMTVPGILYATDSVLSAAIGASVAVALALFRRSLITVAAGASAAVLICQLIVMYI